MTRPAEDVWRQPPRLLRLAHGHVHVWRARLEAAPEYLRLHADVLSEDERARAVRFHFARDREAFIIGRSVQRRILARYLGLSPAALRFRYSAHGKPALAKQDDGGHLYFNVTNSGLLALYAVVTGFEIGVDLEFMHPLEDSLAIAQHFFSAAENKVLRSVPEEEREAAFFRCWTRKEAYVKALGEGLSSPLDCFDVGFAPGEPARLLRIRDQPDEVSRWSMRGLDPGPGYTGAVVVRGAITHFELFHW